MGSSAGLAGCNLLAQACGHVTITFGDQRFIQILPVMRELGKRCFQHVSLLELLDFVLFDGFAADQAGSGCKLVG